MAVVTDTFTDTDGTLLTSHTGEEGATWTLHPSYGGVGSPVIVNNRLRSNSGTGIWLASGVPSGSEYDVEAVLRSFTSTNFAGICGRFDSAALNGYLVWTNGGVWSLFEVVAGSYNSIGTFAHNLIDGTDYTVKLEIRNAAKKVYIDGVERISATNNNITGVGKSGVMFSGAVGDTSGYHLASFVTTNAGGGVATSYTFTGPTSGTVNQASTNFTVTPNGTSTAVVTPATDGSGTFTPSTVTFDGTISGKTFTYTPTSVVGSPHTLSVTNNGGLTDPASIDYTVNPLSSPTMGVLTYESADESEINISFTNATGGSGGYVYDLYRGSYSGFDPTSDGILIESNITSPYSIIGLSVNTDYFFKIVVTDSADQTDESNQIYATLLEETLNIGLIGTSITDGFNVTTKPGTLMGNILSSMGGRRLVNIVNQGVSGSATAAWVSGSTNMNNALTAFSNANIQYVIVTIGINDSTSVSAATYLTNLTNIVNTLVQAGYIVILNYPPGYKPDVTENYNQAALNRLFEYADQIDTLIDNVDVFLGDTTALRYFASNTDELYSDGIHMIDGNDISNERLAKMWAVGFYNAIIDPDTGGQSSIGNVFGGSIIR